MTFYGYVLMHSATGAALLRGEAHIVACVPEHQIGVPDQVLLDYSGGYLIVEYEGLGTYVRGVERCIAKRIVQIATVSRVDVDMPIGRSQ